MKLEQLALSRKNEWWFDLLVEKEVQDYLVGKLHKFSNIAVVLRI